MYVAARGLKAAISTAQLTVVVDDRADVWDQASRKALLQVRYDMACSMAPVVVVGQGVDLATINWKSVVCFTNSVHCWCELLMTSAIDDVTW